MKKLLLISLLTSTILSMQRIPRVGTALLRSSALMARSMATVPQNDPQAETVLQEKRLKLEELEKCRSRWAKIGFTSFLATIGLAAEIACEHPVPCLLLAGSWLAATETIDKELDILEKELKHVEVKEEQE